jgi:DNA-binding NtrC family response regulator
MNQKESETMRPKRLYLLKNIKRLENTPVIIYTTSSLPREREELENLGASKFITKPANFNDLCDSIKKVLSPVASN